jgi:hypothetical protein
MGDRLPNHWEKKERMMRAGRLQHVLSGIGEMGPMCAPWSYPERSFVNRIGTGYSVDKQTVFKFLRGHEIRKIPYLGRY